MRSHAGRKIDGPPPLDRYPRWIADVAQDAAHQIFAGQCRGTPFHTYWCNRAARIIAEAAQGVSEISADHRRRKAAEQGNVTKLPLLPVGG